MNSDAGRIYSNKHIFDTLTSMISSGRLSHAFLLYGEKGLGKKTIARYMAQQILCEGVNAPCMECRDCRMISHGSHPDVISVYHSAENKGFAVKNLREICAGAYIRPNEGKYKVYIFEDCDSMAAASQNTLLKLIEEPPPHAVFIFTASSKGVFLSTVLSRVISLGVCEVSAGECRQALSDRGITDQSLIDEAVGAFFGNIGLCLDYLSGKELKTAVLTAREISDCIIKGNEYALLKAVNTLDRDKAQTKTVLMLLLKVIRDAAVLKAGGDALTGCYPDGSQKLSKKITSRQADELFRTVLEMSRRQDGNANLSLTLTALCAEIKNII